ncbi:phage holin family protein [Pseudalkalibacillus caeni]|uniref:Phage holin family protein n=1 Tax=Exobacillus caeni TaxID=2574798 RepID=A0A5R9FG49_9BACL|nr:phage holin family protein [Pseudalkalibacillus caeni]TLS38525.1 phage holin family protein [Pseudalkalibacillus caeni]
MFRSWIISLLVNSIVLVVVAGFFDSFYLSGFGAAIVASIILAIMNVIVKPILIVLTLPVTILTLGLFLIVINAITLMLTAGIMGEAFSIDGFGMAILASIFIGILNLMIQKAVVDPLKEKK